MRSQRVQTFSLRCMLNAMSILFKLGFVTRKERSVLTWRGRLVLASVFLSLGSLFFIGVHPFLSASKPIPAELLIVESWLPDYAFLNAVSEFKHGGYKYVATTGGTLLDAGSLSHYKTGAEFAAAKLEQLGLPSTCILSVPCAVTDRDRTLASATALRAWLDRTNPGIYSANLYSLGPHARRSHLLFRRALGNKLKLGIIACRELQYDSDHWWRSSEGLRDVFSEAIAYCYSLVVTHS